MKYTAGNTTAFLYISKDTLSQKGSHTSMFITTHEDRPGLLFEILAVFKIKNINMSKIESIPTGEKMGNYHFFIEIDGNQEASDIRDALTFLETIVDVKLLGSYEREFLD
ncbi:MAG: ACT domain-containing protein [Nanoarchaeota archaeon]